MSAANNPLGKSAEPVTWNFKLLAQNDLGGFGGMGEGMSVQIAKDGGTPVDAASILAVMTLGAGYQDTVTLTAEGPEAEAVLDSLAELLSKDLDE